MKSASAFRAVVSSFPARRECAVRRRREHAPRGSTRVLRFHFASCPIPCILQLYVYQMCRSLAYLHGVGICHRDIKPQNLLVDTRTHILKLCDFGSAKALVPGEPSVAYICSRYYRAPELIFGCTDYTVAIDVWSAGCVAGELLQGHPLFPGETGVDQLVEIIKILGTPTREEIDAMNPSYTEFKFPQIRPYPLAKLFRPRAPASAIDLITRMLTYVPSQRITALEACAHPFFDELRDPATRLPEGGALPPLFDWTEAELASASPALREILVPPHARTPANWPAGPGGGSASAASGGSLGAIRAPAGGAGDVATQLGSPLHMSAHVGAAGATVALDDSKSAATLTGTKPQAEVGRQ